MSDPRGITALKAISTASQELHIVVDAFEEGMALLMKVAAGQASAADANAYLLEMERRNLTMPGFYEPRQKISNVIIRTEPPGRFTEVGWERVSDYRKVLLEIVHDSPVQTKHALERPGMRRWFLGQMLARSGRANMDVATVTDLIETVFKEASR